MFRLILVPYLLYATCIFSQSIVNPTTIDFQLLGVETESYIPDELNTKEKLSIAKLQTDLRFSQVSKQLVLTEGIGIAGGKSLDDDRHFMNATGNIAFIKEYQRSNLQGSLIGNWGKGQDFSTSLTTQDQTFIENPNDISSRYFRAGIDFQYTLSSLNQISSSLSREQYNSFEQDYVTHNIIVSLTQVASYRSTLGLQSQYSQQLSESGNKSNFTSILASWNYLIQERHALTLNVGTVRTNQSAQKSDDITGGATYLYLFYNNRVLEDWTSQQESSNEIEPINLSSDKLIDQIFAESLSNSLSISWSRSVTSVEEGASLSLTNTSTINMNNTISTYSSIVSGVQYSKRTDSGLVSGDSEDSNGYINYILNLQEPVPGEIPPHQMRVGYNYSKSLLIETRQKIQRHIITLGVFLAF